MATFEPRIQVLPETLLIGHSLPMTLADDRTFELWRSFMPKRKSIENTLGKELYSVQIYPNLADFGVLTPTTEFVKWAAVAVKAVVHRTKKFDTLLVPEGLYAVFVHRGIPNDFPETMAYIETWLDNAAFELDQRPHFELLGEKYKNNHPESEEEVWIPIKKMIAR